MLTTEMTAEGTRITDRHGNLVANVFYRSSRPNAPWWLVMAEEFDHGGISSNWYRTAKGAEHAALAAYYDAGGE